MTDEEREKLVYHLRQTAILQDTIGAEAGQAADEIGRLAAENKKLKGELDYAWRKIESETRTL